MSDGPAEQVGLPHAQSSEHFATVIGERSASGRFVEVGTISLIEMLPGLEFRPVVGQASMVNFVSFAPHTEAPRHAHEEEQIVVVLDGEFEFELDGDVRTMRPGDVAVIPPFVPHAAWTNDTACREIDVFTPPRRSLLEHARAQVAGSGAEASHEPEAAEE